MTMRNLNSRPTTHAGLYPPRPPRFIWETEEEFGFLGFPTPVLDALRSGPAGLAIRLAVGLGFRDENKLTSLVFYARHPERAGRPLEKDESGFKVLSQEWLNIRDRLVRPVLKGATPSEGPITPGKGTSSSAQATRIRRLGNAVEAAGTLPGFATFAVAAAFTESIWSSTAHNTSPSEVDSSCRLYHGALKRGFYAANPNPESEWCIGSGGWFGLMPATGLAAGGPKGPFARDSPRLIFDPIPSVVMLADFVRRLVKNYGADSWLAVRRGMASPGLVKDGGETHKRSLGVRSRFEKALRKSGADPSFMFKKPDTSGYPGAAELLRRLKGGGL
jgi:hypothetical protein